MHYKIREKINSQLRDFVLSLDDDYGLSGISRRLFDSIKDFVMRDGKRIRPIMFIIGYMGFSGKAAPNLYKSALSIELLHDFMLVHDDIIDRSERRRGGPSMHKSFDELLLEYKDPKFRGEDLGIIVGDIMYAIAIKAFLSVKVDFSLKEKALRNFIDAAIYTGSGEFIELLNGLKGFDELSISDIYRVYDFKTAYYTFSNALSSGAILAGAPFPQVKKLSDFGIYLGRAFQIRDDIRDVFGNEEDTGKPIGSDLRDGKRTLMFWYAHKHATPDGRESMRGAFKKGKVAHRELDAVRRVIRETGALDFSEEEIRRFFVKAKKILDTSAMDSRYKESLIRFSEEIIEV